ncbi:LpqN/LpqT family lipoprotein [[Mycobacterium] fortunisiensis]|uniref:LpqN/LpqT family lipoprotein n=1 Tax=[Mycobacterium] fortunisiensis TaxID=2600579 RepID=UPI0027DEC9F3|nr:LpqN/LpqT family lipoprotein [[Mycobacterium] fortunisiensis]
MAGPNKTISDYVAENKIAETPIKPDEPGTPDFDFPFPPDWSPAGDKTPDWAYGAIVYDKPSDPADPPAIIAIASKLTGNVDPAKILEYAPGQLLNLPEFTSIDEPEKSTLGGFEAVQSAGTYSLDGKARVVAQKTVVIPGADALFVLQLNANAPEEQKDVVIDAAELIDEQTKITR